MSEIYIDDFKIGSIFDNEQLELIENGQIEKIHFENDENKSRLKIFVKYKE